MKLDFNRANEKRTSLKQVQQILICSLFFIFISLVTVLTVNAYFTATASKSGDLTFGAIEVQLLDGENQISTDSFNSKYLSNIMPGSTITFDDVRVKNTGASDVYVLLKLDVDITKTGEATINYSKWYNVYGEEVEINNFAVNQTEANLISAGDYLTTNISWTLNGDVVDTVYQGGTLKATLTAHGVQTGLKNTDKYKNKNLYASYFICTQVGGEDLKDLNKIEPLRALISTNLLDLSQGFSTHNSLQVTMDNNNQIKIPYSVGNSGSSYANHYVPVEAGETYTCGFELIQGGARVCLVLYNSNKTLIKDASIVIDGWTYLAGYDGYYRNGNVSSFVVPEGISYIRIRFIAMNTNSTGSIYKNLQLVKGSEVGEYENYQNVQDVFDINTQTLTRNVAKVELTGEEDWGLPSGLINGYSSYGLTNFFAVANKPFACSHFKTLENVNYSHLSETVATSYLQTTQLIINVKNSVANSQGQTSVEEWKAWLANEYSAGHPVTIWYELSSGQQEKVFTSKNLYNDKQNLHFTTSALDNNTTDNAQYSISGDMLNFIKNKEFVVSAKIKIKEDDNSQIESGVFGNKMTIEYVNSTNGNIVFSKSKIVESYSNNWVFNWINNEQHLNTLTDEQMANVSAINIYFSAFNLATNRNFMVKDIQIELGETPTGFEVYDSTVYKRVNNLVLRQVGEVKDTYDSSTGEITRNIYKYELNGSENVGYAINDDEQFASVYVWNNNLDYPPKENNLNEVLICSHLPYVFNDLTYYERTEEGIMGDENSSIAFMMTFDVSRFGGLTINEWLTKEYENGNPLTIWYVAENLTDE